MFGLGQAIIKLKVSFSMHIMTIEVCHLLFSPDAQT